MKEILVIDDHPIITFSIERIVATYLSGYKVVSFNDSVSLINYVYKTEPSLVIQDLNMDGINPAELIRELNLIIPNVPILVFTSNDEKIHGHFFLKAGARGFLSKDSKSEEIAIAIKKVLDGKLYVSNELAQIMATNFVENKNSSIMDKLTNREYDVLLKLVKGMSTAEIMKDMNLKPQTVATYRQSIFDKLGVNNIIELYELVKLHNL